ncbi:Carbohydrate binding domain protein (fragment) [uncultured Paludibacter sp.]|uniref:non-reducing end alpha-L-arabinofuranosidase n=1 Tax=uncultured Paludibacter sp. TaxID=497635 RepID=A0A653AAR1_9BACT
MKYKRKIFDFFFLFLFIINPNTIIAQNPHLTIDLSKKGVPISPTHYGIFFEDINHAADGGLYAELIRNRSFEDSSSPDYWTVFNSSGALISSAIDDTTKLLNSAQSRALKLVIITDGKPTSYAGVYNSGFWGINVVAGQQYKLSFFAKCDNNFNGKAVASLVDANFTVYAADTISEITSEWKKYTCVLTAKGSNSNARFAISFNSKGTVWLDMVSLFPPTYKNRENGLRPDLAQLLEDMKPKFMRFPGGCFVEGDVLANRFQWKKSIGKIEERPGHWNLWGYRTSDGMGYHEFLQLAEDIDAEPLFVVNVGLAHNDNQSVNDLSGYIQDALDAIEYANGSLYTTYGAMRAANGHPEPFNLKYIEIGNENYHGDNYGNRYLQFYNAIKAKYPEIQCIGNVAAWGTDNPTWTFSYPVDLVDEHYYRNPQWFIDQYKKYDTYSRTGPKIYVGEYAVTSGCGTGNLIAALGEAVYMAGMEKNSDIVPMNSYAPIFVNTNDRKWNPDMIVYNASNSYGTPSYYVQKLFANNIGTVNIEVSDSLNMKLNPITGNVGLGTWSTKAEYSQVSVTNSTNSVLFSDNFANASNWTPTSGTWNVSSGVYQQTSTATDCRSIANVAINDTTYTYSLKARKTSGNEGFLIIFGYKDKDNFYWWNIGGWNNTKHAIEKCSDGSKSTVASISGSISTNVWYDIRIEVSKTQIKCYLNNNLIHTLENKSSQILYTAASEDEINKKLYLKIINPSNSDVSSSLKFNGFQTLNALNGIITELTSSSGLDENSFEQPTKIIPSTNDVNIVGTDLNYNFKANSITIFKLNTDINNAVSTLKKKDETLIFPNPCKDFIKIKGLDNEKAMIEVLNLNGQTVLKEQILLSNKINISFLKSGIYTIIVSKDGKQKTGKLIKE